MIEKNEKIEVLKKFCQKIEKLSLEMDQKASKIEIKENYEKLKNFGEIEGIILASPSENCYVRESVYNKIEKIGKKLKEQGIGLHISDGWRSSEKQQEYWNEEIERTKKEHPEITDAEKIAEIASRFVGNPKNAIGHLTGGSVDISLYHLETGELLDMGSNEDDSCEKSYTDYPFLHSEIKENRELLKTAFEEENFINIQTEWRHYSYGNAEWAAYKDMPYAFYVTIRDSRKFVSNS